MIPPGDPMPGITLHPADAAELAETLDLISNWLARDPGLHPSFAAFIGHPAYGIPQLRDDLHRFTFLLGGNDGEHFLDNQPGRT